MKVCTFWPSLLSLLIMAPLTGLYAQWNAENKPQEPLILHARQHTEIFQCEPQSRRCHLAKPFPQNATTPKILLREEKTATE